MAKAPTKDQLIKVVEELQEVLQPKPALSIKGSPSKLKKEIDSVMEQVFPGDEEGFSDESWQILLDMGMDPEANEAAQEEELPDGSEEEEEEEGTEEEEEEEEEGTEEEEEEEVEETLTGLVGKTKSLADLKTIVEEHDELKKLRSKLPQYKGLQGPRDLKAAMFKVLGVKPPKPVSAPQSGQKRKSVSAERKAFLAPFISKGKYTQKELVEMAEKKFPGASRAALQTLVTDGKNPKYNQFDKLIVADEDKILHFEK